MAISSDEIKYYGATPTGGLDKNYPLGQAVAEQLLPNITPPMRDSGAVLIAKVFANVESPANETAGKPLVFLFNPVSPIYPVSLIKGTATNVASDVNTAQKYSTANLAAGQTITANSSTSVIINTLGSAYAQFITGMKCVLTNQESPLDTVGKRDYLTIQSVTWNGDQATVTFTTPVKYSYDSSRVVNGKTVYTRLASAISYDNVKVAFAVSEKTSTLGTYDESKLQGRNVGCIQQSITITFDNANSFTAVSTTGASLTAGNRNTAWSPVDNLGNQYLSIPADFWGGVWSAGDKLTIAITPAIIPFFVRYDIPAGSESEPTTIPDVFVNFETVK